MLEVILLSVAFRDDLVGGLGPPEQVRALVPASVVGLDRSPRGRDRGEGATPYRVAGYDPEEDLDKVQRPSQRRGDVLRGPLISLQPGRDGPVLVGAVVAAHDVQFDPE